MAKVKSAAQWAEIARKRELFHQQAEEGKIKLLEMARKQIRAISSNNVNF